MNESGHNGEGAARRLLEYLEEQRARRCDALLRQADEDADKLRREARRRALALVREAVRRERSRRSARLSQERARIDARFRRERFRRECAGLESARRALANALERRWKSGVEARREWMRMTCSQALAFLPDGRWEVLHPPGWDTSEASPLLELLQRVRPDVDADFKEGDFTAGLLVSGGTASVDTRPPGLLADGNRVDGLLLRALEAFSENGDPGGSA